MLLLMLTILGLVALIAFLFGVFIGHFGRDQLRQEIAYLRTRQETLIESFQHMKEIAAQALAFARELHFPATKSKPFDFQSVAPDIIFPRVENCPKCAWSVRGAEWPVTCALCGTIFGEEWPDEIA